MTYLLTLHTQVCSPRGFNIVQSPHEIVTLGGRWLGRPWCHGAICNFVMNMHVHTQSTSTYVYMFCTFLLWNRKAWLLTCSVLTPVVESWNIVYTVFHVIKTKRAPSAKRLLEVVFWQTFGVSGNLILFACLQIILTIQAHVEDNEVKHVRTCGMCFWQWAFLLWFSKKTRQVWSSCQGYPCPPHRELHQAEAGRLVSY